MSDARITYSQRSDAEAEVELPVLANIYRLILDSAEKRGRLPDKSGLDDAERNLSDSASNHSTT